MAKREPLKDGMFKDGFNFSKPVAAPVEESVKVEVEEAVPVPAAGEVSPLPEEVSVPEPVPAKSVRKGRRSSGRNAEKVEKVTSKEGGRTHFIIQTRVVKRVRLLHMVWNNCQGLNMSIDDFVELLVDSFSDIHKSEIRI